MSLYHLAALQQSIGRPPETVELATRRRKAIEGAGGLFGSLPSWEPYVGTRGGTGWKSLRTGLVRYQKDRPGEHEHEGTQEEEPHVQGQVARPGEPEVAAAKMEPTGLPSLPSEVEMEAALHEERDPTEKTRTGQTVEPAGVTDPAEKPEPGIPTREEIESLPPGVFGRSNLLAIAGHMPLSAGSGKFLEDMRQREQQGLDETRKMIAEMERLPAEEQKNFDLPEWKRHADIVARALASPAKFTGGAEPAAPDKEQRRLELEREGLALGLFPPHVLHPEHQAELTRLTEDQDKRILKPAERARMTALEMAKHLTPDEAGKAVNKAYALGQAYDLGQLDDRGKEELEDLKNKIGVGDAGTAYKALEHLPEIHARTRKTGEAAVPEEQSSELPDKSMTSEALHQAEIDHRREAVAAHSEQVTAGRKKAFAGLNATGSDNGKSVLVSFPKAPPRNVLEELKKIGFRYLPGEGWTAPLRNQAAVFWAKNYAGYTPKEPEEVPQQSLHGGLHPAEPPPAEIKQKPPAPKVTVPPPPTTGQEIIDLVNRYPFEEAFKEGPSQYMPAFGYGLRFWGNGIYDLKVPGDKGGKTFRDTPQNIAKRLRDREEEWVKKREPEEDQIHAAGERIRQQPPSEDSYSKSAAAERQWFQKLPVGTRVADAAGNVGTIIKRTEVHRTSQRETRYVVRDVAWDEQYRPRAEHFGVETLDPALSWRKAEEGKA